MIAQEVVASSILDPGFELTPPADAVPAVL